MNKILDDQIYVPVSAGWLIPIIRQAISIRNEIGNREIETVAITTDDGIIHTHFPETGQNWSGDINEYRRLWKEQEIDWESDNG